MKKRNSVSLVLLGMLAGLALSGPAARAAEAWAQAVRSPQTVYLDGGETALEAYLIDGSNYVKLREIAAVTDAFNVYWDGAVRIETGTPYTGEAPEADGPVLPTKTAWANYTEDSRIYTQCLNRDTMAISAVRHLPVYKFDTAAELAQFAADFEDVLTLDSGHDEVPSFREAVEEYDENFFAEHTLMLVYVPAGSGSFRYAVRGYRAEDGVFCMEIERTDRSEVYTTDMAGWFLLLEVGDRELAGCAVFDAQDVSTS